MKEIFSFRNKEKRVRARTASLRSLVIITVAIPSLVGLAALVPGLRDAIQTHLQMGPLSSRMTMVYSISNLVHELQKERGLSAGFLGSEGALYGEELEKQRKVSDRGMEKLWDDLTQSAHDKNARKYEQQLQTVVSKLEELNLLRTSVNSLKQRTSKTFEKYSALIKALHTLSTAIVNSSSTNLIAQDLQEYITLSEIKEAFAAQRGILNKAVSDPEQRFSNLLILNTAYSSENIHRNLLGTYSSSTTFSKLQGILEGTDYTFLSSVRSKVLSRQSREVHEVAPKVLWRHATKVVDNCYSLLQELQGHTRAFLAEAIIDADVYLATRITSLILLLLLVVGMVRFLLGKIHEGICSSVEGAERIAKGNMNEPLDIHNPVKEIADLLFALESMRLQLKELADNEKEFFSQLQTTQAAKLNKGIDLITPAIEQIMGSASSVQEKARDTVSALSETSKSVKHLSTAARTLYEGTDHVEQLTSDAAYSSQQGESAAQQHLEQSTIISQQMEQIRREVTTLQARLAAVSEMLSTLQAMADRSKMLAINAEITAANIGVEGSGFSVLAGEMRKLAENSGDSAQKLRDDVEGIENSIAAAVRAISEGISLVEDGVTESHNSHTAIQNLTKIVHGFSDNFSTITGFLKDHDESLKQVKLALDTMKLASRANLASTGNLHDAAGQLERAIERLREPQRSPQTAEIEPPLYHTHLRT